MRRHHPSTLERYAYAVLALVMAICACCGLGGCAAKPIRQDWARVCVEQSTSKRAVDGHCDPAKLDGFAWGYIHDDPASSPELPAVGDTLAEGSFTYDKPSGVSYEEIAYVDPSGGRFAR